MTRDTVRQGVNVLALLLTLVVNGLANALPLNGLTTGEISDSFQVFFVPAAYVFSIWGVIYLGLIGFTIYQALPAQRENPRLRRVGYLFAVSCIANTTWIFLWHYQQFPLTIIAMLILLASLIAIYLRLDINGQERISGAQRWLVDLPFSIYLGWITVATVANVTSVLYDLNWDGFGIAPDTWAVIMLVVATIVTAAVIFSRGDIAYSAVIIWAFIGIVVKQSETQSVALTAAAMVIVIIALLIGKGWANRQPTGSLGRKAGADA